MKSFIKQTATLLILTVFLVSCKKATGGKPVHASVNNSSWQVTMTVTGNTTDQNIFEFSNNGDYFSWHPAAAASYTGTWTQNEATVNFIFKETTVNGDYFWDSIGTLTNNDSVLTGTMQRRGPQGSGTFTAKKL